MITLEEINNAIAIACKMIDISLNVGYESRPFIRADINGLALVLKYVVDKLGRHQEKEVSEGSIEGSIDQAVLRALVPLKNLERALKKAISLPEEEREEALLELSDLSEEYRQKTEKHYATAKNHHSPSKSYIWFMEPERVLQARQEARKKERKRKKNPVS